MNLKPTDYFPCGQRVAVTIAGRVELATVESHGANNWHRLNVVPSRGRKGGRFLVQGNELQAA